MCLNYLCLVNCLPSLCLVRVRQINTFRPWPSTLSDKFTQHSLSSSGVCISKVRIDCRLLSANPWASGESLVVMNRSTLSDHHTSSFLYNYTISLSCQRSSVRLSSIKFWLLHPCVSAEIWLVWSATFLCAPSLSIPLIFIGASHAGRWYNRIDRWYPYKEKGLSTSCLTRFVKAMHRIGVCICEL